MSLSSREIVDILLESFKLSTTQINLPPEQGNFLLQWSRTNIPDNLLFKEEAENGREAEPHITVLYGLTSPVPTPDIQDAIKGTPMFKVEFGPVSIFENERFDVVKLTINSPQMRVLHAKLKSSCLNEYKWPTYEPHATLAYVQPGQGKAFVGKEVFFGEGAPQPFFWAKEVLFSGKGDEPTRESISLRRDKDVAETAEPFSDIAFSDVQAFMKSRGLKYPRKLVM